MKKEINQMLKELYELDPSLKNKEPELKRIIYKMTKYKTNLKIDDKFKSELKQKVLSELEKEKKPISFKNIPKYFWVFLTWAFALVMIVNIFPNILNLEYKPWEELNLAKNNINLSFNNNLEKLDQDKAFWTLAFNQGNSAKWLWWWWASTMSSEKMSISSDTMLAPDFIQKAYIYKLKDWENIPEIPESMFVYKKQNVSIWNKTDNLNQIFKTDILDLSKFTNLWLSDINLYEDTKEWYQINMSLKEWILNIYRDYENRPVIDYMNQKNLSINDIPNNQEIISIANNFAWKYWINTKDYLNPLVIDSWKEQYNNMENKDDFFIPDILSVVYQFEIDWIWVYEEWWDPYWLNSSINIIDMKVNSFWPIQKIDLTWSKYELIRNNEKILEEIKNQNTYFYPMARNNNENIEEEEIEIWNAKIIYLRKYVYNSKDNILEEYFIPWLLFEVLKENNSRNINYFWKYISIPLVWEFIKDNQETFIEPLMEK